MPDAFAGRSPREIRLQEPPSMLLQYLRAGLPHLGGRPDAVPDVVLRLGEVRPDPGQVARYRAVVGEPPADRLPLLYPHLLGFGLQMKLMTAADFPFPPLGLVHVTNEVTCTAPLRPDEPLDVSVHAGAVRAHPRGRVVDLITVVGQGGTVVWTETSSYLRRERSGSGTAQAQPAEAADRPGALHFSARWRLPADLGRRYAAVSGDVNPIHLTSWTARPLGFPRAIAHGMWTAAAVLGSLQGRLPEALTYSVQFRRPISLPSTVRLFTATTGELVAAEVRGREGDDGVRLAAAVRPA